MDGSRSLNIYSIMLLVICGDLDIWENYNCLAIVVLEIPGRLYPVTDGQILSRNIKKYHLSHIFLLLFL